MIDPWIDHDEGVLVTPTIDGGHIYTPLKDLKRMNADEAEQAKRIAQTLHIVNTSTKYCLACLEPRPASQYKCKCGRIATARR